MGDPRGRRIVCRLWLNAGLLTGGTCFDPVAMQMANNEGRAQFARALWSDVMNTCPDQLLKLLSEWKERRERDVGNRRKPI